VIEYFKLKGKCIEISSEQSLENVYSESKACFKLPCRVDHPNMIFVLGSPGSGKRTQCAYIAKEFKFKHISTEDLLRREVSNQSPIGRLAEQYLENGQTTPNVSN
jgi:adenylate kinase family enzyme